MKRYFKYLSLFCACASFHVAFSQSLNKDFVEVIIKDNTYIYVHQDPDKTSNIIDTLYSDTIGFYVNATLNVYDKKNMMYKISYYNDFNEEKNGWIENEGMRILTIPNSKHETYLFEKNNINSDCIVIKEEEIFQEEVCIIDIDMNNKWFKILWTDGKPYWLSPENQCSNPYNSCCGM